MMIVRMFTRKRCNPVQIGVNGGVKNSAKLISRHETPKLLWHQSSHQRLNRHRPTCLPSHQNGRQSRQSDHGKNDIQLAIGCQMAPKNSVRRGRHKESKLDPFSVPWHALLVVFGAAKYKLLRLGIR